MEYTQINGYNHILFYSFSRYICLVFLVCFSVFDTYNSGGLLVLHICVGVIVIWFQLSPSLWGRGCGIFGFSLVSCLYHLLVSFCPFWWQSVYLLQCGYPGWCCWGPFQHLEPCPDIARPFFSFVWASGKKGSGLPKLRILFYCSQGDCWLLLIDEALNF